ncbi:MAG: hypothetical protein ACYC9X_12305 [Dehalococcoidia bacterium]
MIAQAQVPFEVTFTWNLGIGGGAKGTFVWRQTDGKRRWDAAVREANGTRSGDFSVESDLTRDAQVAGPRAMVPSCNWILKAAATEASVECVQAYGPYGSGGPISGELASALSLALAYDARVATPLPGRTIAGRDADCYQFVQPDGSTGNLCVDKKTHIPLYFAAAGRRRGPVQEIQASNLSLLAPSVAMPNDIPFEINATPVVVMRPLTDLLLPTSLIHPQ